ncbi:hypothetical protein BT96DRAFT_927891 [Gymnopus androsaceus JB14]|uniref:Uncharacterized protein n=1 Tax=Gymnopus androsaceus JB14 TaxID=1447944 RepID=A0A6A4GME8_9AGAR|nr:hypothetical protein BT96DRAFT_927891 [Gymnopus androsaceus JB14]
MAHQANENIPTACFTFEPNSLLNASIYRHAQNATAGFLKLSDSHSPAYTISSTTSIASMRTVFKDAYNRILDQIDRKDLAKTQFEKLLKAKEINEWLSDEFGYLCAQNDPHRVLACAERVSHTPLKTTLMVSVYSASPEHELQMLTSFTYLEHKMRLE